MTVSSLELEFDLMWDELYPEIDLETEVKIICDRRYKYDYVHLESLTCIELQGQIWHKGGHNTGSGLMRDYEKFNLAQQLGYVVFQLSREMITEQWIDIIAATIKQRLQLLNYSQNS